MAKIFLSKSKYNIGMTKEPYKIVDLNEIYQKVQAKKKKQQEEEEAAKAQ